MKTLDRISFYMCIVLIIYIFFSEIQSIKTEIKSIKIEKQFVPLTDFELIELAIIWQETKFNPNPKYSDGESEGILQITPIYVKECNSILGYNKYTLHDRRNPLKSHEMFLVVQNYHNSEKDVKKAVKLHSELPTHGRADGMGFGLHRVCFVSKV